MTTATTNTVPGVVDSIDAITPLDAPVPTTARIEQLGEAAGDTPWMAEQRLAAWRAWGRAPMPTNRDEHWRFTNLRRVRIDEVPMHVGMPVAGSGTEAEVAARVAASLTRTVETAGEVLHVDGATGVVDITPGALPEGVIFMTLRQAAVDHPGLLERHLGSVVPATEGVDDKFVALQRATMYDGVLLYVPRGVHVEKPLRADVVMTAAGAVNWRALVVLEEGAEATFVEEYLSADETSAGFSNAVVELVAGAGSNLHFVTVQDYAVPATHFATHRVVAQRDAQVEWSAVGLGASLGKSRMEVRLAGPGSNVRLTGAYFLDGRQELDYDTLQVHDAPNASSDLAFKGALAGRARSVWRGMIAVSEGAQGTDAFQENRNLLLESGAHADAIPGLQIEANEVRCTHAASVAKVDAEQLFYLQARGIDRETAVKEIVRGFFLPVLGRISVEAVRENVQAALWARMDRAAADVAAL